MKQIVSFFLLILLCLPSWAQSVVVHHADTVPFEIGTDRRIYVKAYLNGDIHTPFRFLVDTGASGVVLNASLPTVMKKAKFTGKVLNQGATSSEVIPATSPDQKMQVGHNEVAGLTFIAIPYPPQQWDGVLGLAFLSNFDVIFNYDKKQMYLYAKGKAPKSQAVGIPFVYKANVPVIPVSVVIKGKSYPLQVELDSGSDRVLDVNTPYVKRHGLRGSLPVFAISSISGTSSEQGRLENVCFDSAQIGSIVFPLLPGAFSTLTAGLQSTSEFDGVIGNNLLQRFNQQWDFVNQKVYFTVNHRYYMPFYDFLIAQ